MAAFDMKPLEDDIRDQGREQLVEDGVFGRAEQDRDVQVLLDPAEKGFNRPARLVHVGDFFRRHVP